MKKEPPAGGQGQKGNKRSSSLSQPAKQVQVYDGQKLIGHVHLVEGRHRAFSADWNILGNFATEREAADAVSANYEQWKR